MNKKIKLRYLVIILTAALIVAITAGMLVKSAQKSKPESIRLSIAQQYGLAYAPLQIMKENGYLEAAFDQLVPGVPVEIRWEKMANTAAIQEAMVAGSLDVAFVGIPPFLIGVDQGMNWSIFTGISECPVELYTNDPSIKTLENLVGSGKIAVPQPGSIQHILLAMSAEKTLGNPTAFDKQLVSMKHPDGLQALINQVDIVAQYTSPPYNYIAADTQNLQRLSSGEEAVGQPFSFIVGIAQESFLNETLQVEAFNLALINSIQYIEDQPASTVSLLAKSYELSEPVTQDYLYNRGIVFTREVKGLSAFSQFMTRTGYLKKDYDTQKLIWHAN